MSITKAYVQQQWEEIKRDIRRGFAGSARSALHEYAKDALKEIDAQSSYDSETGNLDESLAAGIYQKGRLDQIVRLHGYADERYVSRTDVDIKTRWGYNFSIQKGNDYSGREESHKALKFYESMINHKYPEDMTMVIVAEMFYRYFLEDKNGRNWIAGFQNFEQSDAAIEAAYKKKWYQNMVNARWGNRVKFNQ